MEQKPKEGVMALHRELLRRAAYCPERCEDGKFYFTAHVTQEWIIDEFGNFEESVVGAEEVTHGPTSTDYWSCTTCGAEAKFREVPVVGLSLGEIMELAEKAGYDWDGEEQKAIVEILGPTGTYEDLPDWQKCDLIDALEMGAREYLQSKGVAK